MRFYAFLYIIILIPAIRAVTIFQVAHSYHWFTVSVPLLIGTIKTGEKEQSESDQYIS